MLYNKKKNAASTKGAHGCVRCDVKTEHTLINERKTVPHVYLCPLLWLGRFYSLS